MRVFLTKEAARYVRKERIADAELSDAISRAERGSVDADLGGGIIKQRINRGGMGRARGARAIIIFWFGEFAVFVHFFSKSDVSNLADHELEAFRELAKLLRFRAREILAGETSFKELRHGSLGEDISH